MKTIKKPGIERTDRAFSQEMADKYAHLKLFTINFAPLLSTTRISLRMRNLELIYALPYLVLRREILNSFTKTKNILASIKQLLSIFVHLELPLRSYKYLLLGSLRTTKLPTVSHKPLTPFLVIQKTLPVEHSGVSSSLQKSEVNLYPPGHSEREILQSEREQKISYFKLPLRESTQLPNHEPPPTRIGAKKELVFQNYQFPIVTHQPPTVSHTPSGVSYKNLDSYMPSTGTSTISPFRYSSESPLKKLAQLVTREPAKVETSFKLLGMSHKPAVFSTKSPTKTMLPGEKEFGNIPLSFKFATRNQPLSPTLGGEKASLYHTYPEIKHVVSTHIETFKERVIEKEVDSKSPQVTPQPPSIDVTRLADQVYSFIERKIKIEKERRGLYG